MSAPRVGDKVRVSREGLVTGVDANGFYYKEDGQAQRRYANASVEILEILERAKREFKDGTVVRRNGYRGADARYGTRVRLGGRWHFLNGEKSYCSDVDMAIALADVDSEYTITHGGYA